MTGFDEVGVGIAAVLTAIATLAGVMLRWHNVLRREIRQSTQAAETAAKQVATNGGGSLRDAVDAIHRELDRRTDELAKVLRSMAETSGIHHDELVKTAGRLASCSERIAVATQQIESMQRELRAHINDESADVRRIVERIDRLHHDAEPWDGVTERRSSQQPWDGQERRRGW